MPIGIFKNRKSQTATFTERLNSVMTQIFAKKSNSSCNLHVSNACDDSMHFLIRSLLVTKIQMRPMTTVLTCGVWVSQPWRWPKRSLHCAICIP